MPVSLRDYNYEQVLSMDAGIKKDKNHSSLILDSKHPRDPALRNKMTSACLDFL